MRVTGKAIAVLLAALVGICASSMPLEAVARQSGIGVLDVSCGALHGCPLEHPANWTPDRLPELGYQLQFSQIHWRHWGSSTARAIGHAAACPDGAPTQSQCVSGSVLFRVYNRGSAPVGHRHIYRCLVIKRIEPSLLQNVPTDVSGYDLLGGSVNCRHRHR
jgi:hypothetical protein